ncbi:unnamed protein product, partial [Prorocentrum cordatum]
GKVVFFAQRRPSTDSQALRILKRRGWFARAVKHRPVIRGTCPIYSGKYYYEVRVNYIYERSDIDIWRIAQGLVDEGSDDKKKSEKGGPAAIGWSTTTFAGDHIASGVGDDRFSWGYEGANPHEHSRLKHNGHRLGQLAEASGASRRGGEVCHRRRLRRSRW